MVFKSKVVITGGAIRIGKAISEAFSAAGYAVRIHFNTSSSEASMLYQSLPGCELIQCDFYTADRDSLRAIVRDCDILINNASIYYPSDLTDDSEQEIISKQQFKINYEIPVSLMDLFVEENRDGCIINMLDAAVLQPTADAGSYFQSKYMLKEATIKKAVDLAPEIRVNGVAPGTTIPPVLLPESEMKKSIASMPLKKAPSVKNVADACVFLAANEGITGEIIRVDGGRHLI